MRPLSSPSLVLRPGRPGLNLFCLLAAAVLAASCAARVYVVSSLAPSRSIVVDGDSQDWGGALAFIEKSDIFVGFINDQDSLYICLTKPAVEAGPGDRDAFPTVWFDPAGGTKKTMGLRLVGAEGPEDGMPPGENGPERRGQKPGQGPPVKDEEGTPPQDRDRVEGITVLGPAGAVQMSLAPESAAALGLEVKIGRSGGLSVLEIKIPLRASEHTPVAVGAGPDGIVGVGFVSSRPQRQGGPGGPSGRGPGGGMPGGGMGPGGGMAGGWRGAMPPNMDPDITKGLKVWTRVRLHRGDGPAPARILRPNAP
jgi:hypothetical protein